MSKNPKDTQHVTLYRKYRPETFKDVIGQDHIVKVLESAVKLGNISHAYIFSGGRGTGKTSLARIFARAIGTSQNDLYEIDAASNRGIDDVRELREGVNVLPFESKYKVYIIDEAHMLTKEAFNALLKTLEEPPAHAIFILATTEQHKLLDTIVSRCQSFTFKKPNLNVLKENILAIAKSEGFKMKPETAELVALLGDGSFRDAQSILEKVFSASSDKEISHGEIEVVLGAPKKSMINNLLEAINAKELEASLEIVHEAETLHSDLQMFLKLLLHKMRSYLLLKYAPELSKDIAEEIGGDDVEFLKKLAQVPGGSINSQVLYDLLDAYEKTSYTAITDLPLELALIKICGKS